MDRRPMCQLRAAFVLAASSSIAAATQPNIPPSELHGASLVPVRSAEDTRAPDRAADGGSAQDRSAEEASALIVEGTIAGIQRAIIKRKVSCEGIVRAYLERIERLDKPLGLNAITVTNPGALADARATDRAVHGGTKEAPPALFCTPLLIKDNIDTTGLPTTAGSIALLHNVPTRDAFLVKRLKAAGAIVLAKTNMAEWAFSPRDSVSSSYGTTANAYDPTRTPAGSSGGTASGIAASFALAGLGTDTGNSVRGPASHAALVGLRPTLGLISRDGIVPLELDRDTAGPLTRTVEDNARLLNVLAATDPADVLTAETSATRPRDYTAFLKLNALEGARLGVVRELALAAQTQPRVLQSFDEAIGILRRAGAQVEDPVSIPNLRAHLEQGDYCARFAFDVNNYLRSPGHAGIPLDVRAIFAAGSYSPHSKADFERFLQGSAEDPAKTTPPCPYGLAHPGRRAFLHDIESAMRASRLDALIYPTWLIVAPRLPDAVTGYRGDNSQLLSPPTGMPAITVPDGFVEGLPTGLQILGRRFDEGKLYGIAYAFEQKTHLRHPPPSTGH